MLKAIIIEDEIAGRNALRNMLLRYCPHVRLVGRDDLDTVAKGINAIRKERPDVVFLDIRLSDSNPEENGFRLLDQVKDVPFELVFVTAFREYGVKAINDDNRTCYFLTKPFDLEALKDAMRRVEENCMQKLNQSLQNQAFSQAPGRIGLPSADGLEFVPLSKLMLLEADGAITRVWLWLESKPRTVAHHLGWFEKHIECSIVSAFFRTHASFIVNRDYVHLFRHEGKKGCLTLVNNLTAKVAEDRKADVLRWLRAGNDY